MKLFENLVAYNSYMGGPPPLDKDFDINTLEAFQREWENGYMPPIRHEFYSIRLVEELNTDLNTGHHTSRPEVPFLLFKSPFQVLSWQTKPGFKKGWHLTFTENFLRDRPQISSIIQSFPFLHLEKVIPFVISAYDRDALITVFQKMQQAGQSDHADRFSMIASYLHIMLFRIRGLYGKAEAADSSLGTMVKESDDALYDEFRHLLDLPHPYHSLNEFAEELEVNPGYLNAVTQRVTGENAPFFIHERLLKKAKELLKTEELSLESIASRLEFREVADFQSFFSQHAGMSPEEYRLASKEKPD